MRATLGKLMAAQDYYEGQQHIPRVSRFLGKQTGPKWRAIRALLRKKARRHERRAAARWARRKP